MTSAARSRRARLARGLGATAAVLLLGTAGVGAWFYQRLDHNITTFSPDGVATSRPPAAPPAPDGGRPVNVLVLGSDSRSGGNGALAGGEAGVGNSDTAILLHVYADHRHAIGVSIPRDTLVTIPPCKLPDGTWSKPHEQAMFNSAFTIGEFPQGNPACSQNTVEALTGLRVDHTIVVDFQGFAAMTDAVHGVEVCVPNDVDAYGIHLTKGRQTLSGQQALDYVRTRHGIGDNSDIGRMKRQQAFLSSLLKKVQDQGFDPTTILPLADAATKSLTVDPDLGSAMKLADFAESLRNIKLADVTFVTMPWQFAGERVAVVHPDADMLWTLLRQDRTIASLAGPAASPSPTDSPTALPSPSTSAPTASDVPVTVRNASGQSGLAGRTATLLAGKGYRNVGVGADTTARATTVITYGDGQRAAAEQLAQSFPGATLRAEPGGDGLTLTLGEDTPGGASPSASALPTAVPSGIAENTRPADTDLCSNLSFG